MANVLKETNTGTASPTSAWDTVATADIAASAVTYAKIQDVGGIKLLGNTSGSSAAVAEIGLGPGLAFVAGALSAAGATLGAGTVSSASVVSANGMAGTVANATTTPAITLTTSITGILKGNGTAIAAAAAGTDYYAPGGAIAASDLPVPSTTTLGGVKALVAVAHNFVTSITVAGLPVAAQPAFSDISGSVAAAQLPNPSASTLGGVQSLAAVTDSFLTTISTSGVPALAVPRGPYKFTAILGVGAVITTGTNSANVYLVCPFAGTFTRWDMVCPSVAQPSGASLVVDVQKSAAGAGSFTTIFTNKPTITTGTNNGGGTVSDFSTTTFSAGDVLRFDVTTAGGGAVQNVTLVISSRMAQ